ncbi:MAG: hypothetical protein WB975_11975, partial [Nitrososphaeraceae archaeon]
MNFNNSGSSPPPPQKKNNSKTIVGIIIAVALAVIGSVVIMQVVMKAQDNMDRVFSPGSSLSYQPTTAEISEKVRLNTSLTPLFFISSNTLRSDEAVKITIFFDSIMPSC